jgi:hypothetical protein
MHQLDNEALAAIAAGMLLAILYANDQPVLPAVRTGLTLALQGFQPVLFVFFVMHKASPLSVDLGTQSSYELSVAFIVD